MEAQKEDKRMISIEDAIAAHRACCPYIGPSTFSIEPFTKRLNRCGNLQTMCANQCYYIKHFIETLECLI